MVGGELVERGQSDVGNPLGRDEQDRRVELGGDRGTGEGVGVLLTAGDDHLRHTVGVVVEGDLGGGGVPVLAVPDACGGHLVRCGGGQGGPEGQRGAREQREGSTGAWHEWETFVGR